MHRLACIVDAQPAFAAGERHTLRAHATLPACLPTCLPGCSPETLAKMSAARLAFMERLGSWPEEWSAKQSAAASARRWGLEVRHRISRTLAGKQRRRG